MINLDLKLTPHFTIRELTKTSYDFLQDLNINSINECIIIHLTRLCVALEILRFVFLNNPLQISSGFRSSPLNMKINGAPNSYHLVGCAADIPYTSFNCPPPVIADRARQLGLFCEIIQESSWVHLAVPQLNPVFGILNHKNIIV